MSNLRTCTRCHQAKPLSEFSRCQSRLDGIKSKCKPCMAMSQKEWYHKTKHTVRNQRVRQQQRLQPGEAWNALGKVAVLTQTEVADILGITPQAVRQTERRALLKLRRFMWAFWRELKAEEAA